MTANLVAQHPATLMFAVKVTQLGTMPHTMPHTMATTLPSTMPFTQEGSTTVAT